MSFVKNIKILNTNRIKYLLILSTLFVLPSLANTLKESPEQKPDKPNILMIIVDDLNDWIGVMNGHKNAKTPNIDALASQGMLFTNAHSTAAICGPSRASIMTGLRPSTSGIYGQIEDKNIKKASEITKNITFLTEYFSQHGYKTMGKGKIFHQGAPKGSFDEFVGREKGFGPKPLKSMAWHDKRTSTDWGAFPERDEQMPDYRTAMWAKEKLLKNYEQPFFLSVGFVRPHVPLHVPQKWFDMHPLTSLVMPAYLKNDQMDTSPLSQAVHEMPMMPTTEWAIKSGEWPKIVQAYLASVSFVDHYVGEILKSLKDSKHADNTIVILWSDHGYHVGEKNRFAKHSLWEETSRVPLIISSPNAKRGQTNSTPVSLLDLYPTLVDLAGLPKNSQNEGVSIKGLIQGLSQETAEGSLAQNKRVAITTYGKDNHAIRGHRYRYIHFDNGDEQLYDHQNDPNEWYNLVNDLDNHPEHLAALKRLKKNLPTINAPISTLMKARASNDYFKKMLTDAGIDFYSKKKS
ncbi:MAG: iduronate 2-sulfatase [Psychromonas sp.]|jgi:iduronate 2-sulfatase